MAAARDALLAADAQLARRLLAADPAFLADLDIQVQAVETRMAELVPASPFAPLLSVPGWGVVRVGNYGAAVGDPARWPGRRQLYRASGLSPAQYESAGRRRDGAISREGSVQLRRALIDLGIGLVAAGAGRETLRADSAGPRQEGRHHRLRDGAPGQQDRLCHGS